MAAIVYDNDWVSAYFGFFLQTGGCGATLIASRWAITAAHCDKNVREIILGLTDLRKASNFGDHDSTYRFVFKLYEKLKVTK